MRKELFFRIFYLFLKTLNFLFENIAAFVAGHADSAASFRRFLDLLAGRAFKISVVFAVAIQVGTERAVKISPVPGELGVHLAVISGKDAVKCEDYQSVA